MDFQASEDHELIRDGVRKVCSAFFGLQPAILHGSEDMRDRHLPRVASGELHVAFGVTEPDAGTDPARTWLCVP